MFIQTFNNRTDLPLVKALRFAYKISVFDIPLCGSIRDEFFGDFSIINYVESQEQIALKNIASFVDQKGRFLG